MYKANNYYQDISYLSLNSYVSKIYYSKYISC